jgi:(2Fe-2S) ferredoxin
MLGFDRHVFVCENQRDPNNIRGCCASKGSPKFTEALKNLCKSRGTGELKVRINKAGCLDACARGPIVVVYPEGVWYSGVTPEDAEEIYTSHIIGGKIVDRLVLKVERNS